MSDLPSSSDPTKASPPPPEVSSLELERLRREVKSRLFGAAGHKPLQIGRYTVLDCIGSGGMGIVYSARDERLGRTVAIKLLKPELSGTNASNLAAEAQSLARLAHPNVVAVYDVGEHDGQLFVAMEYVEGQNLRRWLQSRRSMAEILDVYIAAGKGLFYRQLETGIAAAYDLAAETMACNMMDASALEGVQAFIDKRPPAWS